MDLNGKVALITGADSGIGQATATAFAKAGADVCLTFHTDENGAQDTKRQVEAAGRRALVMQCDVANAASVQAVFDAQYAPLPHKTIELSAAGKHFVMYDDAAWFYAQTDAFLKQPAVARK